MGDTFEIDMNGKQILYIDRTIVENDGRGIRFTFKNGNGDTVKVFLTRNHAMAFWDELRRATEKESSL